MFLFTACVNILNMFLFFSFYNLLRHVLFLNKYKNSNMSYFLHVLTLCLYMQTKTPMTSSFIYVSIWHKWFYKYSTNRASIWETKLPYSMNFLCSFFHFSNVYVDFQHNYCIFLAAFFFYLKSQQSVPFSFRYFHRGLRVNTWPHIS